MDGGWEFFKGSLVRGLRLGLKTTWTLVKISVPVYIVVSLLGATPVIGWISRACEPLMRFFGLPGEAAMVLVIGNALNLYAAIGAMKALALTGHQITTLALMLSFSHNLFVEGALCRRLGLSFWLMAAIRVLMASAAGMVLGMAWGG
ncbi:putative membrane protein [Thermanaerovibrio velox DSM 12556]|uniref:Putative membrane protein n=1 Tax=Thermanaerovibrio velox DSM 12556 TaxID=926567 RepID=H0UQM9_9BACT|nr:nucleoside recognition domain-containing protein [Thermanaerovibrio velox]EHM10793.1 putative membrane protein [Thermanaerovibrio velox DSM 12556]